MYNSDVALSRHVQSAMGAEASAAEQAANSLQNLRTPSSCGVQARCSVKFRSETDMSVSLSSPSGTRGGRVRVGLWVLISSVLLVTGLNTPALFGQAEPAGAPAAAPPAPHGGEANLILPPLDQAEFGGISSRLLLYGGLGVCALGLLFGLVIYSHLKRLPVHASMREVSDLIYETCKTYLMTQGKFLLFLWLFIGSIIYVYFSLLQHMELTKVLIILGFSLIGIAGSFGVAWFGMRINTFANSRTAFASLRGKPFPCYSIPLKAGMSIGMLLISVELVIMLFILLFIPGDYAGPCFIGFAIGESLGAAALRIAGGIFTKIADIGADLMKIVFN